MSTSLVIRFSDHVSRFEATHQRLKDIAEFLGVSQNKAAAYAINKVWEDLAENEEMLEDLEWKRHGVQVGQITHLNHDPVFIERAKQRVANGDPLPHEDDDDLERALSFQFLTEEQQSQIRAASDPKEKRLLKAGFLKENKTLTPDEWGERVVIAKNSPA
jgi:hypothetical protein